MRSGRGASRMRRGRGAWLASLSAALLLSGAADAQPGAAPPAGPKPGAPAPGPTTWFGQALARSDAGLNVTYFWSKGDELRAETVVLGHKIVTILRGGRYISYDALNRVGIDLGRSKAAIAADAARARPFGNELERLLAQGGEKVGEETLQGVPCEIFRITDERGRREVWALKTGSRLPVRVVVFDRRRGARIQTDYVNWQSGLPIDDSFFAPEAGIEFQRMGFEEYSERVLKGGPVGPVPILYADLLIGDE